MPANHAFSDPLSATFADSPSPNALKSRLNRIFFPYADRQLQRVSQKSRFAYYTNAETARRILANEEIWMRDTYDMNDAMEIEYGFDCLHRAFGDAALKSRFMAVLDDCADDLADEVLQRFDNWSPHLKTHTFIACVSKHRSCENHHGRLSMWRAYGGRSGVALILNAEAMLKIPSQALGTYSSPVAYMTASQVRKELRAVVRNMEDARELLCSLGRERVRDNVLSMLHFAVLCIKHPGFHEEREWRIITNAQWPEVAVRTSAIETIRDIPQKVQKIKFRDDPQNGLHGLGLPHLLNRIIIGPNADPQPLKEEFVALLERAGVRHPHKKIVVSNIPLRCD